MKRIWGCVLKTSETTAYIWGYGYRIAGKMRKNGIRAALSSLRLYLNLRDGYVPKNAPDIDIAVHPEDFWKAVEFLEREGFRKDYENDEFFIHYRFRKNGIRAFDLLVYPKIRTVRVKGLEILDPREKILSEIMIKSVFRRVFYGIGYDQLESAKLITLVEDSPLTRMYCRMLQKVPMLMLFTFIPILYLRLLFGVRVKILPLRKVIYHEFRRVKKLLSFLIGRAFGRKLSHEELELWL